MRPQSRSINVKSAGTLPLVWLSKPVNERKSDVGAAEIECGHIRERGRASQFGKVNLTAELHV
jgi:hypothetical protein